MVVSSSGVRGKRQSALTERIYRPDSDENPPCFFAHACLDLKYGTASTINYSVIEAFKDVEVINNNNNNNNNLLI